MLFLLVKGKHQRFTMASSNPGGGRSARYSTSQKSISTSIGDDGRHSQQEIAEEREHFKAVVNAFLYYR